jgi:hypothetical protein
VSPECFYLHIDGEQRGPYTIAQIDHLLNSGLIREEASYWREGMEQWQPVTNLVRLRKPARSWVKRAVMAALLVALLLLVRFFGPTTVMGWREAAQTDFTPVAAYWRARDVVRHGALPPSSLVTFGGFSTAKVEMLADGAKVWLPAELSSPRGVTQLAAWNVELHYDSKERAWSSVSVTEAVKGTTPR